MSLISVIIPVYNAEKYLEDCICSVLEQSYKEFEVILIEDGSTDCSLEICERLAKKDDRIHVFSQKNSGASAARNRGLDEAIGEWIVFVDSDDKVLSEYLACLYSSTRRDANIDLCIDGVAVYRNGYWTENKNFPNIICDISDVNTIFSEIQLHKYGFSVGKLYRRSIIEKNCLRFDEKVCIAEDLMFMVRYMLAASKKDNSKVCFIEKCNYCYNVHQGSLSTSCSSFENELYSYNEYRNTINQLKVAFNINNSNIEFKMYSPIAYYADRCINAILLRPISLDWKERLDMIDRAEYQKYKRCCTMFESLLKFLFVHRFWYLLLLLRR